MKRTKIRVEKRNLREQAVQVEKNGVEQVSNPPRQTTGRKHDREGQRSSKKLNVKCNRF